MQQIPVTIRDEIESINIPPMPHVLLRFLKVVEDDRASITDLATLVGLDPALSARFLTVANSPALRREREITSLEQCMITLGTRLARTLAACLAVQNVFARAAGEMQYDFKGFWGHSLRVAEMSRAIAANKGYVDIEEAYLAGLMHDVGILILLGSEGQRYGDFLGRSIDESVLSDIEKPMIGTDHAAVGAWLVDRWKLPSFMSDAILFHHRSPDEIAAADPLSQIVWSAHVISTYNEKLDLTHIGNLPDLAAVVSILGIDVNEVATIRDQASGQVVLLATALGVKESADAGMLPSPVIPFEICRSRQNQNDPVYTNMDDKVRDMALMQSLQHNLSSMGGEEDVFIAVKESAKILFSLGRLAFLLVNPAKSVLSGANFLGQSPLLQRLEIKLDPNCSLAAAVVSGERPYSTFDKDRPTEVSLVDVQIAHILDSEGLLYVPMRIRDRNIGVMVYGISILQHSRIQKRLAWMTHFAHLAAVSIDKSRELRSHGEKIEATVTNRFELHARRIVHEAGNPLAIIKNYLKIVTRKIPGENDVCQELDVLREEIDRVSHILQRLKSLEDTAPVSGTVDINGVIEGMLSLYSDPLFSACGITVELALDPSVSPVSGDRDSVKQILLNIWKNAAEAMSEGGRVVISTRGPVTKNGRHFVEIIMNDSGPGLPPDVKQRLFQPLGQDRRPGHSGIGLSVVASLVKRLEGFITCQSDPGQGTTFSILLPRTNGEEQ
jgi:HD-like signal output (HDOD) protein/nitrogen-specific signal transduction histidine kinase